MSSAHFKTRASLERQIDQARQLRAETLAHGAWIIIMSLQGILAARRRFLRMGGRAVRA